MELKDRIQHAWNAFKNNNERNVDHGPSYSRPGHKTLNVFSSSSFVSSIYNRIAIDVSMAKLRHVKVNPKNEDVTEMKSGLNNCFDVEANIDQTGIQFMHDLVYSMFDEGCIAVVPVETSISPNKTDSYSIDTMRVGKVVQWFPRDVRVNLYNEETGQNEDILLPKKMVAIIENPLYSVMNAENSTLKRLINKINQLDRLDTISASGRLDLIMQLPHGIKSDLQKQMADEKVKEFERQLEMGKHGITYIDGVEKIHQLNRPLESQLPASIAELKDEFYNQLGLTKTIFNGTATEEELRIYYSRTIDPIIEHIIAEFERKFLTKTGRAQGQQIQYYRDMFKFVTVEMITSLGDTVRRNQIMTSNEMRKILGLRPSSDPNADVLDNPNIADKNQDKPRLNGDNMGRSRPQAEKREARDDKPK